MNTPTLGEPRFAFTHTHPISDELRIPERIEIGPSRDFSSSWLALEANFFSTRNKRALAL